MSVNDSYVPEAALQTMKYLFGKSGIYAMDFVPDHIVIHDGADKATSSSLGAIIRPCEEHPEGGIVLYMDAIIHYSNYIGKDFLHIAGKVMFIQTHNLLTYKKKGAFSFPKAETFAARACHKLLQQGIFTWEPPVFYMNTDNEMMKYQLLLRQEWIKKWTGMELADVAKELEAK